jgi:hypothetical protein
LKKWLKKLCGSKVKMAFFEFRELLLRFNMECDQRKQMGSSMQELLEKRHALQNDNGTFMLQKDM